MIELHCHLDGSLPIPLVERLARERNLPIPTGDDLKNILMVEPDNDSLAMYLEKFQLPLKLLQDAASLRLAAREVAGQSAAEGVLYAEIRFAPLLHLQEGMNCRQAIEAVALGLKDAKQAYGIQAASILCAMRHMDPAENMKMVKTGQEFLGEGVCGIDLAGDEASWPASTHTAVFEYARSENIPYTIHAGECGSAANVADAIDMGARRIGHGVAAYKDASVMKKCAASGVALELCPVSNMHTKAVEGWDVYPIIDFLDVGINATVNTDNRTVSGTSLGHEFGMLEQKLGLTHAQKQQLLTNAINAAFTDDSTKDALLKQI